LVCHPFIKQAFAAVRNGFWIAPASNGSFRRAELPDLPWAAMIGMRNRLVHAYFDINRDMLWTTVTEAAPALAQRLRKILERA
jgi:uncharacterized protein with HEPN domain